MKKIIITAIIFTILLSGCVEPNKNEVYRSPVDNETITLYTDSVFTAIGTSSSSSGTYRIEGEQLTLIAAPLGNVLIMKRNSTGLYYQTGGYLERIQ